MDKPNYGYTTVVLLKGSYVFWSQPKALPCGCLALQAFSARQFWSLGRTWMDCGWDKQPGGKNVAHDFCSFRLFTMNCMVFVNLFMQCQTWRFFSHWANHLWSGSPATPSWMSFIALHVFFCNQWIPRNFVCGSDRTAVWKTSSHLNELSRNHLTHWKMKWSVNALNLDTAKVALLEENCTPKSTIGSKVKDLSIAGCSLKQVYTSRFACPVKKMFVWWQPSPLSSWLGPSWWFKIFTKGFLHDDISQWIWGYAISYLRDEKPCP